MKKLIGLILVLMGISSFIVAMNENINYHNFIGALLFGLSCLLGAKHANGELHPIDWVLNEYECLKQRFIFWRL